MEDTMVSAIFAKQATILTELAEKLRQGADVNFAVEILDELASVAEESSRAVLEIA